MANQLNMSPKAVWMFTKVRQKLMGPDHGSLLRIAGDVELIFQQFRLSVAAG